MFFFFIELPQEGFKNARELWTERVEMKVNDTVRVDRRGVQEKGGEFNSKEKRRQQKDQGREVSRCRGGQKVLNISSERMFILIPLHYSSYFL